MASKTTQDSARTELITMRATKKEKARLAAFAKAEGTDVAEILRSSVNQAASVARRAHVFR